MVNIQYYSPEAVALHGIKVAEGALEDGAEAGRQVRHAPQQACAASWCWRRGRQQKRGRCLSPLRRGYLLLLEVRVLLHEHHGIILLLLLGVGRLEAHAGRRGRQLRRRR